MSRRNDEIWLKQFELYKRYVVEALRFPAIRTVSEGYNIGQWLQNQLSALKGGFLPEYRRNMLDEFHPAWKESASVRAEAERQMCLASDWRSKVPAGDVCIDKVLNGANLESCVLNGIYGCKQYLEAFAVCRSDSSDCFRDSHVRARLSQPFGEDVFSWHNRKAVFHVVFPRVHFESFHLVCAVWGIGGPGRFLRDAQDYQQRSPFECQKEMRDVVTDLLQSLPDLEADVLVRRACFGKTFVEIGNEFDLNTEQVRHIESKALKRMRHPVRSQQMKMLEDVQEETLSERLLDAQMRSESTEMRGWRFNEQEK